MIKKYYIGVCIRKSGHAVVTTPYPSLDECLESMKKYVSRHFDEVDSTTYMVREGENLTLKDVFGSPKSRDLKQDKKWIKSL